MLLHCRGSWKTFVADERTHLCTIFSSTQTFSSSNIKTDRREVNLANLKFNLLNCPIYPLCFYTVGWDHWSVYNKYIQISGWDTEIADWGKVTRLHANLTRLQYKKGSYHNVMEIFFRNITKRKCTLHSVPWFLAWSIANRCQKSKVVWWSSIDMIGLYVLIKRWLYQ